MPNPTPSANPSAPQGEQIVFGEDLEDHSWKSKIFQPFTLAAACLVIGLLLVLAFLEERSIDRHLPVPQVSYELQRNDGVTAGVPIAIKIDQIAVFQISDPMEGGTGAERAKKIVSTLQSTLDNLQNQPGKTVTLDIDSELPAIVISQPDGTERHSLVQLEPADLTLASDSDGKRVARVWAERLTDAIKVFVFGEAPKFSKGTEFGDSLEALYSSAMKRGGAISKSSLDSAYASLDDSQKQILEHIPALAPAPPIQQ